MDRILQVAIEILDREGETALTFRGLADELATGSGAIYWHVTDKSTLLAAATDQVVEQALASLPKRSAPRDSIRALALGIFDTIRARPWVGGQLSREPWQHAVLRILELVGTHLKALGIGRRAQFDAATAVLSYLLGLAGQYSADARRFAHAADRSAFLTRVATEWSRLDAARYPFVRQIALQLAGHDDRQQFLAGINLILAGIGATRSAARVSRQSNRHRQ